MTKKEVKLSNLFAKYQNPIAELVHIACKHNSSIVAVTGNHKVNLKSIMGVMAISWDEGQVIEISAEGNDEEDAVSEISKFLQHEK